MNTSHKDNWEEVRNLFEENVGKNFANFGSYYSYAINNNFKQFMIILSRYKFVCKMLKYKENIDVLEVGCGEAIGSIMLKQEVDLNSYTGIDQDEKALEWAKSHFSEEVNFINEDFLLYDSQKKYDAIYSLDVIEHIDKSIEDDFIKKMADLLKKDGFVIIVNPNVTMTPYASETSKAGHINLFDQKRLYKLLNKYFDNVFIFGMNDEIVATGYEPMACYIFAVCAGVKKGKN